MQQTWITQFRKDPVRTLDAFLWDRYDASKISDLPLECDVREWLEEGATTKDVKKFDWALAKVIANRFQRRETDQLDDRLHAEKCWLRTFQLICTIHPDNVDRSIQELQAIGRHGVIFFANLPDADTRDPLYWRFCIAAFNGNLRRMGRMLTGRR